MNAVEELCSRLGRSLPPLFECAAAPQQGVRVRTPLVFLLSTGSRAAARRIAEHVLAGCVDLSHLTVGRPDHVFVSLFDDTQDIWREEEFSLVEQYSKIARWSRPDEFEHTLRAA